MMTTEKACAAESNDAELVAESLAGGREAFRQIVERHQTLVCSLAYCATGSLTQSEDLAQETFLAAWRQLAELREPSKLRPWLCGIARFVIGKELRRQGREPVHAAETLESVNELAAPDPLPSERVISKEEQAILWHCVARIPEIYREPLVLFYREHQSIERVAEALELSEDAVKQRLARGRKMLQEQALAYVEGALKSTNPGQRLHARSPGGVAAVRHRGQGLDGGRGGQGKLHRQDGRRIGCSRRDTPFLFNARLLGIPGRLRRLLDEPGLREVIPTMRECHPLLAHRVRQFRRVSCRVAFHSTAAVVGVSASRYPGAVLPGLQPWMVQPWRNIMVGRFWRRGGSRPADMGSALVA